MRLSQAVFVEAVRCIDSDRSVNAFLSVESITRADGYGYELEAGDAGVFAKHKSKPGVERFIPWTNVKWVDVAQEPKAEEPKFWGVNRDITPIGDIHPLSTAPPLADDAFLKAVAQVETVAGKPPGICVPPKREHWKTRQKREREEGQS